MIVDMKPKLISALRLLGFEALRPLRQVAFLDHPFKIQPFFVQNYVKFHKLLKYKILSFMKITKKCGDSNLSFITLVTIRISNI